MELQDLKLCFWYDHLRVKTIRYLDDYIQSKKITLAELKDCFRRSLPEEERKKVKNVKALVDALEKGGVIGPNNVEILKMLAEALELQKLKDIIEGFETECVGIFKKTLNAAGRVSGFVWQKFKGGVCATALHVRTVLSIKGVPLLAGAVFMYVFGLHPEKLKDFQPFLDYGARVIEILKGSVVFVLKVSSIPSLKQLWQSYGDGSLKEKLKKDFNEMEELKELSHGEEIDVEVTINEEEYREVLLDLILLEVKGNSMKNTKRQRRHSVCCERGDVPEESSKAMDMTQIQIRVGRPFTELEKSIDSIRRLTKGFGEVSNVAKCEVERLSEIRRQLSEMEISLVATGFSKIRTMKEAEELRLPKEDVTRNIPITMKEKSSEEFGGRTLRKSLSALEAAQRVSVIKREAELLRQSLSRHDEEAAQRVSVIKREAELLRQSLSRHDEEVKRISKIKKEEELRYLETLSRHDEEVATSFSNVKLKKEEELRLPKKDVTRNIPFTMKEKSSEEFGDRTLRKSLSVERDEEVATGFSKIRMKEAEELRLPKKDVTRNIPFTMKEKSSEESGDRTLRKSLSVERDEEVKRNSRMREEADLRYRELLSRLEEASKPKSRIKLRDYQKELAAPALEGMNTIICAPTNSDKTFVAMKIAKRHLDAYIPKKNAKRPKVVFVVDTPTSVANGRARFEEYLFGYSISGISERHVNVNLHRMIQDNDVIVLTAQILVNALEDKSVHITDLTLLVFDECHHANKEHPYRKVMQTYLKTKLYGVSKTKKLPQVVGLSVFLDVTTEEQVLQMCANLDASNISTVRKNTNKLKRFCRQVPEYSRISVQKKPNIFEKEINKNMEEIENFVKRPPPTTNREAESYRQWIEALESDATKLENNDHFICAQQLRRYHEALLINNNVRIEDAILYLDEYFEGLDKTKFNKTESWLQQSLLKTKERIEKYFQEAGMPENPLLKKLQDQIEGFHAKATEECQAKGILFTRTREYAYALKRWMEDTEELKAILRPEVLLGSASLTQSQQEKVIMDFKEGTINIIITTVAEEGLDIPKCNYVIHYGVKGNEISSVQSRGRIRAEEGGYYVPWIDAMSKGAEHEKRNEYREMLMTLAVEDAQNMEKEEFLKKIEALQSSSVRAVKKKQELQEEKKSQRKYVVDQSVVFYCRKCNALVCNAQDIRRFKEAHHVVINKEIYERIDIKPHEKPNTYDDIYFGKKIYCKKCGHDWGVIITVEGTELPCLKVVSLVTTLNHGKLRKLFKNWKDLPFKICEATLEEIIQAEDDQ